MISEVASWLFRGTFFRSVGILASGAIIARILPIVTSPVLTRVYSPQEFGSSAVILAIASMISPALSGRYDMALVLPRRDADAVHLLHVSIVLTVLVAGLTGIALIIFHTQILISLGEPDAGAWLFLAPLILLFNGIMAALTYFANRQGDFWFIAKSQILNSAVSAITTVIIGLAGGGFAGIVVGVTAGAATSATVLAIGYRSHLRRVSWTDWSGKRVLLKRYIRFPVYDAPTALLDGLGGAIPTFFLSKFFSPAVVGYHSLVIRSVNTPLSILASSVSQVNLKTVAELVNEGTPIRPYLARLTAGLTAIVLVPTVALMIWGAQIVAWMFGGAWSQAGELLEILAPALGIRFVVATISTTLGPTDHLRLSAAWKILAFGGTFLVYSIYAPPGNMVVLFRGVVLADFIAYSAYFMAIWYAAGNPLRNREPMPSNTGP
jgi:O-antigen/teichoic acid export membrane protein